MDVLELDAASESGVDDIRESIVETVDYQPAFCRFRIYIIDEVHDLSRNAFDALLKTIEEPPSHVVFILATTELTKVPPTIRSRCQRFDFHRGSIAELVERLTYVAKSESVEFEPAALSAIARMSDGGFRDALTLLEQAILTCEGSITLQQVYDQLGLVTNDLVDSILVAIKDKNIGKIVELIESTYKSGKDPRSLLESLILRLSDLTRASLGLESASGFDATQEASHKSTAAQLGAENILKLRGLFSDAHRIIRDITLPRVWLESELIRISLLDHQSESKESVKKSTQEVLPTKITEVKVTKSVESESTNDPVLAQARQDWSTVVASLASQSAVAKERLAQTRIHKIESGTAHVEFTKIVHFEMVQGSKLEKAIREAWSKTTGQELELSFFFIAGKAAVLPVDDKPTAVELPLDGERLVEVVHEIFGVASEDKK